MQTIGDAMRAEAKAEAEAKGEAKGVHQGMARTLTLVLETRFGDLPEEVRDMIGTTDAPQLDRWTVRTVDAPTLDVVTGDDTRSASLPWEQHFIQMPAPRPSGGFCTTPQPAASTISSLDGG